MILIFVVLLLMMILFLAYLGVEIVPHQQVWIVERLGRFHRTLSSGLNWLLPMADIVSYKHSLKEEAIDVPEQTAITQDNVSVTLDGVVYIKIIDPISASYGVKNPLHALTQLVQTTMRSEVGKIPLDKTFEEREALNLKMVEVVNQAAFSWGIQCIRYEIKDIKMPQDIQKAMELQMTAERQKRARILESEGMRQSQINESEGQRQSKINIAEGAQVERIQRAKAEAEAIALLSQASACGIERIAIALREPGGDEAASLHLAEKYIDAFRQLAKESNTVILPANLADPASMVTGALSLYQHMQKKMNVNHTTLHK